MAPTDARKKIDQQKRKNKLKAKRKAAANAKPGSAPRPAAKIKDLRQVLVKKKNSNKNTTTNSSTRKPNKITKRKSITDRQRTQPRGNPTSNKNSSAPGRGRSSSGNNSSSRRNNNNGSSASVHQNHAAPPTYIISTHAPPQHPLAMDGVEHQSASVLISNLLPTITQSDIIELFGDVGSMTAVNMINQTTALVTYQYSGDAVRAVKVYHNRLLDGKPMMVNMMPIPPGSTTNIRQRVGQSSVVGSGHSNSINTSYTPRR